MMNIYELIHDDHQKILGGFVELIVGKTQSKRDAVFPGLAELLLSHMRAEEEVFYPLLVEDADNPEPVWQAQEEHRAGRCLLSDLRELPTSDPRFRARVKVLHDLIERHVREEENELFSLAGEVIDSDQALSLAEEFLSAKQGIPAGRPR